MRIFTCSEIELRDFAGTGATVLRGRQDRRLRRAWFKAGQGVSYQTGQESRSTGHRAGRSVTVIATKHKRRQGMKAHVSSILLGVEDIDRSKRFYTEGLGWEIEQDHW
jgi:Bleomycin resistance protein-like N-terminal